MDFAWDRLPEPLADGLRVGGAGKRHLTRLARQCLADASGTLAPLGVDLLLAAWESDPLDADLARQLLALVPGLAGTVPGQTLEALCRLAPAGGPPKRPSGRGDPERLLAALVADRLDPALLRPALDLAWREDLADRAAEFLARGTWPEPLEPLRLLLLGNALFLGRDVAAAREAYAGSYALLPLETARCRLGECLLRLGERESAARLWLESLRVRPWSVNLTLKAFDLVRGVRDLREPLPGPLAVLLYTYDKAALLDAALASLFASQLGQARVFVLDNGSADATAEVLSAWQDRVGERLMRIDLPVNVGAPAARNWLARLPEVAACQWAAYLDDDALVPQDWLALLGGAVSARPEAGVWGCKVVDAAGPAVIQNADLHVWPRQVGAEPGIEVSDLHLEEPDYGQFDYLRPCVSVTGCCHLFRTRLLAGQAFDIALSPSQFDDIEHDLRMNLKGLPAIYQGHLCVRHLKRTGELGRTDPRAAANAFGNRAKLERGYAGRPARDIAGQNQARLAEDLARKTKVLAEAAVDLLA